MEQTPRRQFVRQVGVFSGASVVPFAVAGMVATGSPGGQQVQPQSGDRLDYERDAAGDIDFDWADLSFETRGSTIELENSVFSVESVPFRGIELDVDFGPIRIDLEIQLGVGFDFQVDVGDLTISSEASASGLEVKMPAAGVEMLEDESTGEFELRAEGATVEFSPDARKLEIRGPLEIDIRLSRTGTVSFEYDDGIHHLDLERSGRNRVLDLEYAGPEVTLEWTEADREFEAWRS